MASPVGIFFLDHFAALRDPRQIWKVVLPLPEVLFVVLRGTLAGVEDFVDIRRWARLHIVFLRRFLLLASGFSVGLEPCCGSPRRLPGTPLLIPRSTQG